MTIDSNKESKQDTEYKILHAAELEFSAKGFAGARTTTIAESAGVTHAMLHYYFRTKEKLFDRIISEKIAKLKAILMPSEVNYEQPLNNVIRRMIEQHLDFVASNPELPRFIVGELFSDSGRASIILKQIREYAPYAVSRLQEKIDETAAKGLCRRVDAGVLLLDIASLNIFSFLTTPIVNAAFNNCMSDMSTFLAMRKQENYDTIMRKLRP